MEEETATTESFPRRETCKPLDMSEREGKRRGATHTKIQRASDVCAFNFASSCSMMVIHFSEGAFGRHSVARGFIARTISHDRCGISLHSSFNQ